MKKTIAIVLCFLATGIHTNLKSQNTDMTEEQKFSYALGQNAAEYLKGAGVTLDVNALAEGGKDAVAGDSKFSTEEMNQVFMLLQMRMQEQMNKAANEEKARGLAFLAENKKKEGVVETPSGLQYKVITMGTGAKPTATDVVKVHYHGTTIDGVVFDSSVERGEQITFPLNRVIKGWTEGLQLMPVGSKFIFWIPSDLAYGDQAPSEKIKPGSTLIFEVELFDINPQ
ncbi:FKBP-type peptidyl-prolyl cis-trans isomerase [Bacteroidales bacterium OttesenSCG-928-C03]|nr:FKBP-type peptidyl-prolyl cis-trans isomerase [Bacteroidales bacterium OttesenSCG-928-C03]